MIVTWCSAATGCGCSAMSSPEPVGPEPATIPVAPREIVDLVARLLRIHGVDPGAAHDTATAVMHCQAAGHPSFASLIDAVKGDETAAIREPHEHHHIDPATLATAFDSGISLGEPVLRELERAAAGFLVAEHVLDSIADEPTAD